MEDEMVNEGVEEKKALLSFTTSGFPFRLFKEWNKECIEKFGNCRWMKMWHDHLMAKQIDVFVVLIEQIESLKKRMDNLELSLISKPKEKPLTIGDAKEMEVE